MVPETKTCIGNHDKLSTATRPLPIPAAGETLIKVAAAGVNRSDIFQYQGAYPPSPRGSDIPGLETAGTVAALRDGVANLAVGDKVIALVTGGGYAPAGTLR